MSESPHVPVVGELRVTVPLPGVVVDATLERGRYVVRPGLELVKLDMSERARLSESVYNIVTMCAWSSSEWLTASMSRQQSQRVRSLTAPWHC
jgi:hypothetical protein